MALSTDGKIEAAAFSGERFVPAGGERPDEISSITRSRLAISTLLGRSHVGVTSVAEMIKTVVECWRRWRGVLEIVVDAGPEIHTASD